MTSTISPALASPALTSPALARSKMAETFEARLIFALSFVVFLVAAALVRLAPRRLGHFGGRRSIFGDARSAASECVSFAFMG